MATAGGQGAAAIPGANDDLGYKIDVIVWILLALSGIILSLRLWCKWLKSRGLWWDDHLLIVSWVLLVASAIVGSYNRTLGFGKHVFAVNPANYAALDLDGNIATTLSVLAAVWSKSSFALTMLRLMQELPKKILIWFIIISMNLAMYTTILLSWYRCEPPAKVQHCVDGNSYLGYSIFSGAYSAAMDFILAFLPWPLVLSLQMKKKEKFGVAIAMSLGIFAGVTSIMKTVALPTMEHGDFTYDGAQLVIWGNAEVATTIMAASIPVLRVLFLQVKSSAERRYYDSGSKRTRVNGTMERLGSKHNTTISARRGPGGESNANGGNPAGGRDDRSDRSILDNRGPSSGKIIQTNEVMLEYSERSVHEDHDNSDGWYEMEDKKARHAHTAV